MTRDELINDINIFLDKYYKFLHYSRIRVKPHIRGTKSTFENLKKAQKWCNEFIKVSKKAHEYWLQQIPAYWVWAKDYHRQLPEVRELDILIKCMKPRLTLPTALLREYKNVVKIDGAGNKTDTSSTQTIN